MEQTSVILLAGGTGSRMGGSLPKQFRPLSGKPLIFHSLEVFLAMPTVDEVIIVCAPEYRHHFKNLSVRFAAPGNRRQDSLSSGLSKVSSSTQWICVHDAARPFIDQEMLTRLFLAGKTVGAATLGVPIKPTIKEVSSGGFVVRTLERERVWEIQTPQFLSKQLLLEGFARAEHRTVTDDVSLAELAGHPVKIVEGNYRNLKITTIEDLAIAEALFAHV